MGIKINDIVFVEKGGEIIPKIIGVKFDSRNDGTKRSEINIPENCPVCDCLLHKEEGLVDHFCINEYCFARVVGKFFHFASKDAMDINGLGDAKIEQLVYSSKVRKLSDLYYLKYDNLLLINNVWLFCLFFLPSLLSL